MTRTLCVLSSPRPQPRQKGPLGLNRGGIHHKALAISRGGKGSVGLEQLEELGCRREPDEPARGPARRRGRGPTAAGARSSRSGREIERGVEETHPSRSRFLSELSARNDNSTSRLLQPQRAATLLGGADGLPRASSSALKKTTAVLGRCEVTVGTRPGRPRSSAVALADASNGGVWWLTSAIKASEEVSD